LMRRLWRRRSRKPASRYLSVLDLGAFAVKALVIECSGDRATILGRGSATHRGGIAADCTIGDARALETACERALTQAEDGTEAVRGRKVVPDAAAIAVPTAWVRGALGSGRVLRPNLEDGVTAQECIEPLLSAGRQAMRRVGRVTRGGEWELLDATVVTFSIDGHRVTDPVGFRGHSLEATVLVLAVPSRLVAALRSTADKLQLEPPALVAEPLALAAASPGDGLIIQVGALTTALVLSRYGAPVSFASICQGGAAFAKALGEAIGVSTDRADVMLRGFALGQLSDSDRSRVEAALGESLLRWLSSMIESLRSWTEIPGEWPPFIHLCGGVSRLGALGRAVAQTRWLEALPFPFTPQVKTWDGSNVEQVLDRTNRRWQLDGLTTLSLAAWALRDRGPSTRDGILRASLDITPTL
jgi:hypothetical protein